MDKKVDGVLVTCHNYYSITHQGKTEMRHTAREIEIIIRVFWARYEFQIIFVAFQAAVVTTIAITR